MAGSMIGADLADLDNTSLTFNGFSETARGSGTTVVGSTRQAVSNIEAETNAAEATIIDAVQSMQTGMANANATMQGAQYVGRNADVARDASADLDRRVAQAVADVTETFQGFKTRISALGVELEAIATDFDAYAAATAESGASVSRAMSTQSAELDGVMNRGLLFG